MFPRILWISAGVSLSSGARSGISEYRPPGPTTQSELDQTLHHIASRTLHVTSGLPILKPSGDRVWTQYKEFLRPGIFPGKSGDTEKPFYLAQPAIYRAGDSAVYTIEAFSQQYVIKYHRFCPGGVFDPIDGLVVEYYFLKRLHKIPDLTHKVFYLSAPIDDPLVAGKLTSGETLCPDYSVPTVRFMISEKVGLSVADYARSQGGTLDVDSVINIAMQMIGLLEALQFRNFIHGDAHYGNYALSAQNPDKIILIDFGRARVINVHSDFPLGERTHIKGVSGDRRVVLCHHSISPWESKALKPSFRDDVFRVFIAIALLIHGREYLNHITGMCAQKKLENKYLNFLTNENILDLGRTVRTQLPPDTLSHLGAAMGIVRATRIDRKPDYDAILFELQQIKR